MYLFDRLISLFLYYFRPVIKGFLRRTTGLCELQRICYGTEKGAERTIKVENSLNLSRSKVIKNIRDRMRIMSEERGNFNTENMKEVVNLIEYAVEAIVIDKRIKPGIHQELLKYLRTGFLQIYGYKQLIYDVNTLRCIFYDSNNVEHEKLLLGLWAILMPEVKLSNRLSRQWTEIGFQGDDPKTDFRGMGLLGLENLYYFASKYPETAKNILLHSNHPIHGYPFAITGINLTHMAYTMLIDGSLKTHFFNEYYGSPCIEDFHKVYCYFFIHFDKFWIHEKPKDIMEFRLIKEKFLNDLDMKLKNFKTILKWEPVVKLL